MCSSDCCTALFEKSWKHISGLAAPHGTGIGWLTETEYSEYLLACAQVAYESVD